MRQATNALLAAPVALAARFGAASATLDPDPGRPRARPGVRPRRRRPRNRRSRKPRSRPGPRRSCRSPRRRSRRPSRLIADSRSRSPSPSRRRWTPRRSPAPSRWNRRSPSTCRGTATGKILTVTPRGRWSLGTFTTVTVPAGTLAASGQPLARPARSVFLTRDATTASIIPTAHLRDAGRIGHEASSCRSASPSTPRRSADRDPARPTDRRHRPSAAPARGSDTLRIHAVRPTALRRPLPAHRLGRPRRRRPPARGRRSRRPDRQGPGRRPLPPVRQEHRTWPATPRSRFASPRRWIGAAPPARSRSRSAARPSPGQGLVRPRTTRSSCSARMRHFHTGRRSRCW